MADVEEWAARYLRAGWSIAPVGRTGRSLPEWKHPRAWKEWQSRLATAKDVASWVESGELENIAVITGRLSGVVVVDVDPKHGGIVDGLPDTGCIARTGGGGYHYVYRYPTRNKRQKLGIDKIENRSFGKSHPLAERRGRDIRGDGGLIIVDPSIHPGDPNAEPPIPPGGEYKWIRWDPHQLAEAPEWVLVREVEQKDEETDERKKWVTELLTKGTERGRRNDDSTRLVGYFASAGIPRDIGQALLANWHQNQANPLPLREQNTIVRSVYKTEEEKEETEFAVLTLSDFMTRYGSTEVEWTIGGWLPRSTTGLIVSPPAGYKTWLTYDLAASVASGQPFLDTFAVQNPGPVLIVQQEDFLGDVASRNGTVIMSRMRVPQPSVDGEDFSFTMVPSDSKVPIYFHVERKIRFDDETVMAALRKTITELGITLVIIDPLYSAAAAEGYMTEAAQQMMVLKDIRDETGCSFLIVHHTRKASPDWDRQNTWGSQFLNAWTETQWQIRREVNKSKVVLQRHFKVAGVQPYTEVDFEIDIPTSTYRVKTRDVTEEETEAATKVETVRGKKTKKEGDNEEILSSIEEGAATVEMIAEHTSYTASFIKSELKKLTRKGLVELGADNKYRLFQPGKKSQ